MTELEKMMRGELYDYSDPETMELNLQAHDRLENSMRPVTGTSQTIAPPCRS